MRVSRLREMLLRDIAQPISGNVSKIPSSKILSKKGPQMQVRPWWEIQTVCQHDPDKTCTKEYCRLPVYHLKPHVLHWLSFWYFRWADDVSFEKTREKRWGYTDVVKEHAVSTRSIDDIHNLEHSKSPTPRTADPPVGGPRSSKPFSQNYIAVEVLAFFCLATPRRACREARKKILRHS